MDASDPSPLLSRRTLGLALAGGAALAASPVSAASYTWTNKVFERFWTAPSAEITRNATYNPNLTAHWPYIARPLVGPALYIKAVTTLLELAPDVRLTVVDQIETDDLHFIRWVARGTPPVGPHEWTGSGCVHTRDGEMVENWIFSEHPLFRLMAEKIGEA